MLTFKEYLAEGGNIKIGDVGAAPFKVTEKNREERQSDIHGALSSMHKSFHKEHGEHLFGKDQKALKSGSLFAGSTRQLMGKEVPHAEFAKHKPTVGDIDVQIPKEHKEKLTQHLAPGKKFGNYSVVGTKKHGNEVSAVMKHKSGEHHQFDFEATDYHKDEPTKGEQFTHNSSWEDTKAGIKGAHHKILINAVGGEHHKFSITHGVRSRTDEKDPGNKDPEHVTKTLFGPKADPKKIESFHGVTQLIKKHIPASQHQEIFDKFKSSAKKFDNTAAVEHLKKHLNVKDTVTEEKSSEEVHHTSVIPLVGFSPISHMGHAQDLGGAMSKLPGKKHIGISGKSDAFSPEERSSIMKRQWKQPDVEHHVVKSGGETVARAFHSLPKTGKKVLHLLVGADRRDFAHGLKKSLEAGKVKEMGDHKFDEIHVHEPEDSERSHGMSGTKMRTAAAAGSTQTFHKHLGTMFSKDEAINIMKKVKSGIASGAVKVKR